MKAVELQELVGGALQEKFSKSFEKVVDNLQDVNTSFKTKRKITITLDFTQNENRDDVSVNVSVVEKLAPSAPLATKFAIGKNLATGESYAEEYGRQIKGQLSFDDMTQPQPVQKTADGKLVDTETGEIIEAAEETGIVDFRKKALTN
nr:MAG TPA: hypothetical protein [Bacteriophage sp.]